MTLAQSQNIIKQDFDTSKWINFEQLIDKELSRLTDKEIEPSFIGALGAQFTNTLSVELSVLCEMISRELGFAEKVDPDKVLGHLRITSIRHKKRTSLYYHRLHNLCEESYKAVDPETVYPVHITKSTEAWKLNHPLWEMLEKDNYIVSETDAKCGEFELY